MLERSVKRVLWSYDLGKIDVEKDEKLIINQVLNWGDLKAINWLFKTYKKGRVAEVASKLPVGNWNIKSLNFWSLVLGIKPKERFERV